MLVSIFIENYLSFKEPVTFSLEASPIKEHFDSNTFETSITGLRLLKGCAIYGANGSGKSNLLKALRFITRFINESAKESQANDSIDITHFKLSTSTEGKPSVIEIKLIVNDVMYRYGFEADKIRVHREWLYATKKIKEYCFFERNGNTYNIDLAKFSEGDEAIQSRTRENVLFLSAVAQWNGEIASNVIKGINDIMFLGDEPLKPNYTLSLSKDPQYKPSIQSLLDSADLGINSFITQQITYPESYLRELTLDRRKEIPHEQVYMLHNKLDENNSIVGETSLDLVTEESQGTKKFFYLAG
ncbi:MAG: AAA family ATPase, partial [Holophaga sp.]